MTTPENAGLTEAQREINRLRWLLLESAGRANIEVTTGGIDAMARNIRDVMHENDLIMCWLSDFEYRVNGPSGDAA